METKGGRKVMNEYSHGAGDELLGKIKDFNPERHVFEQGSRRHVISYVDGIGEVCSEAECEINTRRVENVRIQP
jgi:hypothetical protein